LSVDQISTDLPARIESDRVYLRSYRAGDGSWLYAVSQKNRQHLARYESENFLMNIENPEAAEAIACELEADWINRVCFFMPVFEKDSNEFVAQVYLGLTNRDLPEFALGFISDVNYQGQGYVTESVKAALNFVFQNLNAHRVFTECDDTNQRSLAVIERCGFIREGCLRENRQHPDSPISSTYIYGLLKSDYDSLNLGKFIVYE
jgi:RimJ/RimL family protein N-acetyltransferase